MKIEQGAGGNFPVSLLSVADFSRAALAGQGGTRTGTGLVGICCGPASFFRGIKKQRRLAPPRDIKKQRRLAPPLSLKVSELRLCRTADPPRPFQLRLAPHSFCPSVASRESFSRLSLSTPGRLSQETANLFRVTRLVRPLLVAEPGLGDALSTTRVLAVSSTLLSSGGSAF